MTHALVCLNNATYGGVYYCSNFTTSGAQPTWVKLTTTGLANLECSHFRVDYGDPLNKQFVRLSNEYLYYRDGGNWTKILDHTIAAAAAGVSATNSVLKHLWTDPTTPGSVYCAFMTDPAPLQNGYCYVMKSLDYGATWTAHLYRNPTANNIYTVEAYGDHIWASFSKILIANSGINYSNDGGATWKGEVLVSVGGGGGATTRVNPRHPNQCWLYSGAINTYYDWTAGPGYTATARAIDPSVSIVPRCDMAWFDPDIEGRAIACKPDGELWWSDDDFVTSNTTVQTSGLANNKCGITGPDNQPGNAELVHGSRSNTGNFAVGCFSSETDTSGANRAGTNTATPPYTDAVPDVVELADYGIWFGSAPAAKGIYLYSVEEGDINNIPDADNLGLPLFGDRSSWRDYDADDDGDGTELSRYHAQDIRDDMPQRHNPWPATNGQAPVSDGTKWVPTDIITQAEFDYSFYVVSPHCPVTLDADAETILDLQGGCTPAQEIGLDVQQPTHVFIGPSFMPPDEPTFRPMYIEELANVTTTAPVLDGEVLTFDGGTGQWVNDEPARHNRIVTTLTAGTYNIDSTYDVVVLDATAGDITINLPNTSSNDGLEYAFKRIDATANIVSIMPADTTLLDSDGEILTDSDGETLEDSDGGGGDTIDGETVQYLDSQYLAIQIVADADGSAWWII